MIDQEEDGLYVKSVGNPTYPELVKLPLVAQSQIVLYNCALFRSLLLK